MRIFVRHTPPVLKSKVTAADVDREADRRVASIIPKSQQMQLLTRGLANLLTHGPDLQAWPEGERSEIQPALLVHEQTSAIRARAEAIKAMAELPDDISDDAHW